MTAEQAVRSPLKKKPFGSIQDHVRDLKTHGVFSLCGDLKEAKERKDERARSATLMRFPEINWYRAPKPREFAEDPEIQPNHLD